jgi:hypothetical protein
LSRREGGAAVVWTVVLLVVVAALAVGAFVTECALCRRERSRNAPDRMDAPTVS